MKNLLGTFSSMFYNKMGVVGGDKSPIISSSSSNGGGGGDFDDAVSTGNTNDNDNNALAASSSSSIANNSSMIRIVQFPRINDSSASSNTISSSISCGGAGDGLAQHESVSCPSCDGSGRIPIERERQLVALIPFTDKRLKPRRTTFNVLVAVVGSVVVCSLCMFFLIPRSITLTSSDFDIIPYEALSNETESLIKLAFVNEVNITNNNYVSIKIVNATMASIHVLDSRHVVGQAANLTQWTLPLRRRGVVAFNTSITFDTMLMINYCKLVEVIYMQFEFMVTSQYLGHEEQSGLTVSQRLYCTSTKRGGGLANVASTTTQRRH